MSDLSRFPIAQRWPAQHPDRIQLYSLNTPNGVKASIMLEETGLPYEPHLVDIRSEPADDVACAPELPPLPVLPPRPAWPSMWSWELARSPQSTHDRALDCAGECRPPASMA